jgi:phospholipase D1/2
MSQNTKQNFYTPDIDRVCLRTVTPLNESTSTGFATENLWVSDAPFSLPTGGNDVTPLTTGKDYYAALKAEIKNATTSIYISGWQVNWDAQLDDSGTRLVDVILEAVTSPGKENLKIYVMPWDDPSAVQTYDDECKYVLNVINQLAKRECVFIRLSKAHPDEDPMFYSHHQKHVVIDNKKAFVGGIDICYGRFDDANYKLKADAEGRKALNRYNGCVSQVGTIKKEDGIDPFNEKDKNAVIKAIQGRNKGASQIPATDNYSTLDPATQPRMPWQDVHVKIEGPAASYIAINFTLRWNISRDSTEAKDKLTPDLVLPKLPSNSKGKCFVQVLRSAPLNMCRLERQPLSKADQEDINNPLKVQDNIYLAMETLISKAEHFIYIENQFFVSNFGNASIDIESKVHTGPGKEVYAYWSALATREYAKHPDQPPQNGLCKSLADRIDHFIWFDKDYPFHVYITLPVHPEGGLNTPNIITQVHWTMQTLVFGSHSLLNRIRRSLKARKMADAGDSNWEKAYSDDKLYLDIPIKDCFQYVTLLNLRNYENLGSEIDPRYVTEQIYIHSKMMIVDDRYALVGSANINDRSLLGGRDSELAVLIMDTESSNVDLCGDGDARPIRGFARKLRTSVWKKIFGITAGGSRAATVLEDAIKKPGAKASWEKIQEVAKVNTKLYEAAFDYIPRNEDVFKSKNAKNILLAASIWPTRARNPKNQTSLIMPMPFEKEFWLQRRFHKESATKLKAGIKGFITLLPIDWTNGENNNMNYAISLVAKNEEKFASFKYRVGNASFQAANMT